MAGCPAYQWVAQNQGMIEANLPFCASARTSPHNFAFLEGVKAALCADAAWNGGDHDSSPVAGLKAFGRVYAGWLFRNPSSARHCTRILDLTGSKTCWWVGRSTLSNGGLPMICSSNWPHGRQETSRQIPPYTGDFHAASCAVRAVRARSLCPARRLSIFLRKTTRSMPCTCRAEFRPCASPPLGPQRRQPGK